jgi:hypothetical protein
MSFHHHYQMLMYTQGNLNYCLHPIFIYLEDAVFDINQKSISKMTHTIPAFELYETFDRNSFRLSILIIQGLNSFYT